MIAVELLYPKPQCNEFILTRLWIYDGCSITGCKSMKYTAFFIYYERDPAVQSVTTRAFPEKVRVDIARFQ